ncbi:hypothetical protein AALP_AAs69824U000100, partial [Arabis alpina]
AGYDGCSGKVLNPTSQLGSLCSHGAKPHSVTQLCLLKAMSDLKPPLWRCSSFPPAMSKPPNLSLRQPTVSFSCNSLVFMGLLLLEGMAHKIIALLGVLVTGFRLERMWILSNFNVVTISSLQIVVTSAIVRQLGWECKSKSLDSLVTRTKARAALDEEKRTCSVKSDSFHMGRAFSLGSAVSKLHVVFHDSFDVFCFSFILTLCFVTESI